MINNNDLPNSERFSNANWKDKLKEAGENIKKEIEKAKDKLEGQNKEVLKSELPSESNPEFSKTEIFGVHPVTIVISVVGLLVLSIAGVLIYKQFNK